MKLSAIMLIFNSFFANQQDVDVVSKIIEPIQHISAEAPLSRLEFDEKAAVVSKVAIFCLENDIIGQLDVANQKLMLYYQDIDSFDLLLEKISNELKFDIFSITSLIDTVISATKNDLQLKLTEFEKEILKRGADVKQLSDVRALKQVLSKATRFFSEFKTLVAQAKVINVELTRSFLSEDDVSSLAKLTDAHFKGLSV